MASSASKGAILSRMPTLSRLVQRLRRTILHQSQLDMVIPPEIVDDAFSLTIKHLVAQPDVRMVLEIGSSSGAGSTASIVAAMESKPSKALYCIELSEPRFRKLSARYKHLPWVHCLNLPSVPLDKMPTPGDVAAFYAAHPTSPIHRSKLAEVQRWLQQDIEYLQRSEWEGTGIEVARRSAGIDTFDLVLIDGSEFSGEAELSELYGARYVLLDDTLTYKNSANVARLSADPKYKLHVEDKSCRNGFAAFTMDDRVAGGN